MSLPYKILAIIVVLCTTFGIAYWEGRNSVAPEIQTVIQKEKADTQIVYRDRIVTVTKVITKKPDGTTTETDTTKTEESNKETDKEVDTSTDSKQIVPTNLEPPKYSLGVRYIAEYKDLFPAPTGGSLANWEGSLGYRVIGPAWLDVSAGEKRLGLGIRIEW